jgi:hypothetical protein
VDILGRARKLEARIARTIDRAAQRVVTPGGREPLELMHVIVDAVEDEVQAGGRDTRVFPFNRIKVSVAAPARHVRARLEAVFEGPPSLRDRIVERLEAAGCDVPGLTVKVAYVAQPAPGWPSPDCHVEFDRVSASEPAPPPAPAPTRIRLTVLAGVAEQAQYSFALGRIDLGRCAQVRDQRQRLVRSNHVAFVDTEAPHNQSVSRRHAHIRYLPDEGGYRLFDDRSAQGTGVLRNGRTLAVPPGSRGIRLQSGDEIVLGEARLRVTCDH